MDGYSALRKPWAACWPMRKRGNCPEAVRMASLRRSRRVSDRWCHSAQRIDRTEREAGRAQKRPRIKQTDIGELLASAGSHV